MKHKSPLKTFNDLMIFLRLMINRKTGFSKYSNPAIMFHEIFSAISEILDKINETAVKYAYLFIKYYMKYHTKSFKTENLRKNRIS